MNFDINKSTAFSDTYRVQAIKGRFDLNAEHLNEHFKGEIPIENMDWSVGLIYGNSGTGKTTIAQQLFKTDYFVNFDYASKSIIDDMPDNCDVNQITEMFNKVGFSSPPSWIRPYHVLSNGEKMRVDLARCLLENRDLIVFDEFTSVVDRTVAKIASYCVQKAVKKQKKKFIAISCHSDIIEWLQPDWTFYTNDMSFKATRGLLQRPEIKIEVYQCGRRAWRLFRKYHYLNTNLSTAAKCFVGIIEDNPAAFACSVYHPHPKEKKMMRGHRVVVLPEYQGLGIGHKLQSYEAQYYLNKGWRFIMSLSHRSLALSARKDPLWICTKKPSKNIRRNLGSYNGNKKIDNRLTMSFEYIGKSQIHKHIVNQNAHA